MKLLDDKCYLELIKLKKEVNGVIDEVSNGKVSLKDAEKTTRELANRLTELGYTCRANIVDRSYNHFVSVKCDLGTFKITYYRATKSFKISKTIDYLLTINEEDTPVAFKNIKDGYVAYRYKKIFHDKYEIPGLGWGNIEYMNPELINKVNNKN